MASSRTDVVVWAEDLKAGRLPKVSPVSGESADVPRKFRFRTAPGWVWPLIAAGVLIGVGWIPGVAIMLAVSKRAAGPVFLTRTEKRSINVKLAISWGLLGATFLGFAMVFTVAPDYKGFALLGALVALIGWLICLLVVLPRIQPKAVVHRISSGATTVELRQVHPAFAEAVQTMYRQSGAAAETSPG
jgi:hypothetical protein